MVYVVCAIAVACVAVGFALFNIYSGVKDSLSSARVGDVYKFEYLQPVTEVPKRFMVKVVGITSLTDEHISRLNAKSRYRRYDPEFQRTHHLVTGQSYDGKIRNFYAERVVNCRRPLLGRVVFNTGLASFLL